ncbi:hypothetical protein [Candidatus Odyssella thessalonicensis]|uniref:hypothetical protein n=1 Tax=Candidatus Odyssella thessalonicensis TaxID=84647 RepID=UPI000225A933|nr:hypothetical protein [Candidatus Odyssella thessalonicensis]
MKKSMKFALVAAVLVAGISGTFAGNEQTADEARDRMDMLSELFKDKGLNSFNFLNGHDGAGSGKNRENQAGLRWAELTKSDDRRGQIICVENGRYAVNQLDPRKVGRDTMSGADTWRDGQGMPMTEKILAALRNSSNGKAVVNYVETTPGVDNERQGKASEEKFELLAYSSSAILGKKNDTGSKFFCAVRYQQFEPTDESEANRLANPDYKPGEKKHHKKAKKHVKKAEPKAEAKEDAKAA